MKRWLAARLCRTAASPKASRRPLYDCHGFRNILSYDTPIFEAPQDVFRHTAQKRGQISRGPDGKLCAQRPRPPASLPCKHGRARKRGNIKAFAHVRPSGADDLVDLGAGAIHYFELHVKRAQISGERTWNAKEMAREKITLKSHNCQNFQKYIAFIQQTAAGKRKKFGFFGCNSFVTMITWDGSAEMGRYLLRGTYALRER